jgi:cell division protein FtsB
MSVPIYSDRNPFEEKNTMKRLLLSTALILGTLSGVKGADAAATLDSIAGDIATTHQGVQTLQAAVTAVDARIQALQAGAPTIDSRIQALQTTATTLQTTVQQLVPYTSSCTRSLNAYRFS